MHLNGPQVLQFEFSNVLVEDLIQVEALINDQTTSKHRINEVFNQLVASQKIEMIPLFYEDRRVDILYECDPECTESRLHNCVLDSSLMCALMHKPINLRLMDEILSFPIDIEKLFPCLYIADNEAINMIMNANHPDIDPNYMLPYLCSKNDIDESVINRILQDPKIGNSNPFDGKDLDPCIIDLISKLKPCYEPKESTIFHSIAQFIISKNQNIKILKSLLNHPLCNPRVALKLIYFANLDQDLTFIQSGMLDELSKKVNKLESLKPNK